jgi:hypothetical protein
LIVEDEFLIAEDCALTAEEAGFDVAGPYSKLKDVPQDLAGISAAILDLNVCGVLTYPLIDRLIEMNIPVTLYTGYRAYYGRQKYANRPRLKAADLRRGRQGNCAATGTPDICAFTLASDGKLDRDQHAGVTSRIVVGIKDRELAIAKEQLVGCQQRALKP